MALNKLFRWLALLLIIGAVYVVYAGNRPCSKPVGYKIGSIDPGFNLSTEEFQTEMAKAAGLWNKALGKPLLQYDPNARLTVSLHYDERQQLTNLRSQIDADASVAESIRAEYQRMLSEYSQKKSAYQSALAEYRTRSESYNAEVDRWNARGGAPQKVYDQLVSERESLRSLERTLSNMSDELNTQAKKVNDFIDRYNLLAQHINESVSKVNQSAGEFEEGLYDPNKDTIDIYEYEDETALLRVLAHELGHALGLDHVANVDSVMYKLNSSKSRQLSPEDVAALKSLCGV